MSGTPPPGYPSGARADEALSSYVAKGLWTQRPLSSHLRDAIADVPDRPAVVTRQGSTRTALTYRELGERVDRVRAGLSRLGVGRGDVVAVMLPNVAEFAELIWAVAELGAVYSGIPTPYGRREAGFILRRTRAKVLVLPETLRGRDFIDFARELAWETEHLRSVLVLGESPNEPGWMSLDALAEQSPEAHAAAPEEAPPGSLFHLGFTSGTTGEPKAVMNTHQTLDAVLAGWVQHVGLGSFGEYLVNLVCSPIGHHTGFLWGVLLSAYVQGTAVCLDRWDASVAADVIREEEVTTMVAAPTFLQDLVRVQGADREGLPSLRVVAIPGAPIPRSLVPTAREQLGCFICPAWGMTEYGIGISVSPDTSTERINATDGAPVTNCEVRVVDRVTREAVPPGEVGALEIAGPGLFLGYLDRPDATAEAVVEGWFRTGDLAIQHEDGCLELQGRTKDIIIRGGENIPVIDVENLLYRHPAVLDAAVVGVPDERLGERACAVLAVPTGTTLALSDITEFLLAEGLSKHFLPERLELVEALPKTMSGKIRKVELREWLTGRNELEHSA